MDISLSLDLNAVASSSPTANNPLGFNLNQIVDAQVVETQTMLNSFNLKVASYTLQVQAQQAVNLQNGQSVQLQVVKLLPTPEFKLVAPGNSAASDQAPVLKLVNILDRAVPFSNIANGGQLQNQENRPFLQTLMLSAGSRDTANALDLQLNLILSAKIINNSGSGNSITLNIAGKNLEMQTERPLSFQAGQTVQLQVVKLQPQIQFGVVNTTLANADAQTATGKADAANAQLETQSLQAMQKSAGGLPILDATVVKIAGNRITLQLSLETAGGSQKPESLTITLDRKQLLFPESDGSGKQRSELFNTLKIGNQLNLQVLSAGKLPMFAATVLPMPSALSAEKINSIFKQLLPQQNSPAELINYLRQIESLLQNNPGLGDTLKSLAKVILALIPTQGELSDSAKLQENVANSGLFLESKLAGLLAGQADINLAGDLKFNLLKFTQLLRNEMDANAQFDHNELVKALLQKTSAGLAKITIDQFNSIPTEDASNQCWLLELPYFQQDKAASLRLEIHRDQRQAHDGAADGPHSGKNWAVSITITPPELATIHCRISCYDGAVNTRFWSQAADTVAKIKTNLNYLQEQFVQKGLKTGFMEAHQGKPAQPDILPNSKLNLLSEKV